MGERSVQSTFVATALASVLLLSGCSVQGSTDAPSGDAPRRESVVTVTQIEPDDSDTTTSSGGMHAGGSAVGSSGRKTGSGSDKKESSHDTLSACLGSIAEKAADDHNNPLVEKETVRDLFKLTIEGDEFELPCPVTKFFEKEWGYELGYSFEDMSYDPGFSFDVDLWYKDDQNFNISIKLKNTTDKIVAGNDLTVVGISIKPMYSFVSFDSAVGVSRDSDLDTMLAVLGCNDESALQDDKIFVKYHVSLYDKPLYDMNSTIYADVTYEWNKVGRVLTGLSLELMEPWDEDLRLTDEELEEKHADDEPDEDDQTAWVGRTVEGV